MTKASAHDITHSTTTHLIYLCIKKHTKIFLLLFLNSQSMIIYLSYSTFDACKYIFNRGRLHYSFYVRVALRQLVNDKNDDDEDV